jgi:hypothetical protein
MSSVTGRWMRTVQHALQPVAVAHRHGLVEVELGAQVRDGGRVALLARHRDRRIAGQQLLQSEDQDRDEEQRRQDRREAREEEAAHRAPRLSTTTLAAARARRAWA